MNDTTFEEVWKKFYEETSEIYLSDKSIFRAGYEAAENIPEWLDPQLQFEAEEPEMPKGDW